MGMNMFVFVRAFFVIVAFTVTQFSFSMEVSKLGFISTERVYREAKVSKAALKRLDNEFGARQNALKKIQKEGLALQKRLLESKLDASVRIQLESELSVLNGQYRTQAQTLAEDYNLRRNEEFASIQERANRLIKEIAQKEGFDLILQEAVYVNPKYDLTQKLINALDQ